MPQPETKAGSRASREDASVDPDTRPSSTERHGGLLTGLAVVTVIIGVALRFAPSGPLWLDEALSVNIASLAFADVPEALRHDGHPVGFYWLLGGWLRVVGSGDDAVRALSGLVSVLALPAAWAIGARIGGRRTAAFALVVMAINPYVLRYATETRMYALVMTLVLVGWLLIDRSLERPAMARLAGVAAVTALLVHTHYWALFLVASTAGVLAVAAWRDEPDSDQRRARIRTTVAVVIGGATFAPWLPTFLEQSAHTATPWGDPSRPTATAAAALIDLGGFAALERFLVVAILTAGFVLVLSRERPGPSDTSGPGSDRGTAVDLGVDPNVAGPLLVALSTLAIGALATWVGGSAFSSRYAAAFAPILLVVAAHGLSRLTAPLDLLTLTVLAVLSIGVAGDEVTTERTQAGVIAEAIDEARTSGPAPVVVYCPDQLGPAIDRALDHPDDLDQVVYPDLDPPAVESPERIEWYDYEDRHDDVDPADVATVLDERAGPERSVIVASNANYRVPGEDCAELVHELGLRRVQSELVGAAGNRYFEHANLHLFEPAP